MTRTPRQTLRFFWLLALTAGGTLMSAASVSAHWCPFCGAINSKSLAEEVGEASIVLYGTLGKAVIGDPEGTTEFLVAKEIKGHPAVANKKTVVLPRYLPPPENAETRFLIFVAVIDDKLDPYRIVQVDDKEYIDYIQGALAAVKKPAAERLGFFFKHLENRILDVSTDAYKEFAVAPFADVKAAVKSFDPDQIVAWLTNKETMGYKLGLYGVLIGVTGRKDDAKVLRRILDSSGDVRPVTGIDGIMGGYCMLDTKAGVEYTLNRLAEQKVDFNDRYAALRTVKFLLTDMPEISRDEIFRKMAKAIDSPDIADLVIDEFRLNGVWTETDRILGLYETPRFNVLVVTRAIIRYALRCPDPKAAAFISEIKKKDPQLVADVEEILRFEDINRQENEKLKAAAKKTN